MKNILLFVFALLSFSVFSQNTINVYSEASDFQHRIYAGSQLPLRVHVGYELQYKRLQLGGFVGFTPKRYQDGVFYVLQKVKNEYMDELEYLKVAAQPKIQFGGELKMDVGKNFSLGLTAQTFNARIIDTPQKLTRGILPEEATVLEANISDFSKFSPDIKTFYETKPVEAYMNTIVAGPVIEKIFWLDKSQTFFIKAKFAYWILVKKDYNLVSQDYSSLEQLGIDTFKPRFLNKLERVSSKLQAPSFGLELGIAF
jgi:hypothetical protein